MGSLKKYIPVEKNLFPEEEIVNVVDVDVTSDAPATDLEETAVEYVDGSNPINNKKATTIKALAIIGVVALVYKAVKEDN